MEVKDWVTGFAAVMAAVLGLVNLYLQIRDRGENLLIEEGTRVPALHQYTSFFVVNLGKNNIDIRDYGFVLHSGKLLSIPYAFETAEPPYDEIHAYGMKEKRLAPHDHAEAGMVIPGRVAGYYAQTTTRRRLVLRFCDVGLLQKLRLRWKLWQKISYA